MSKPTNGAIHPRVSVNAMCSKDWSLEQDLDFYRSAGVTSVGVMMRKLLPDLDAGIAAIRSASLQVSTVAAENRGFDFLSEQTLGPSLAKVEKAIDVAALLGSPSCYFITGATPSRLPTEAAARRFAVAIEPAMRHARERRIRLAIEHNATSTRENGFVHSLGDAVEVARLAQLEVCVELQNCWMELNVGRLLREHASSFALVQVSDFVVGTPVRLARAVPGDGDMPLEWALGELLEGGYTGAFDLEILGPRIDAEGYAAAIGRSIEWLSRRLWDWGVAA